MLFSMAFSAFFCPIDQRLELELSLVVGQYVMNQNELDALMIICKICIYK